MMKKIISIMLILTIIVNISGTVSFASAPYDYTDPKCIDIRELGTINNYISKPNKVCGCKKCTLDAVTYAGLSDYIDKLNARLSKLDGDIPYEKRDSIYHETLKHGSVQILLLTESVAVTLFPMNTLGNIIVGIIMFGGTVAGFITQHMQNQYDITIFENTIKMQNIELILKSISRAIDSKGYKNKNFFIATTNYDRHSPDVNAQFAKKDSITYDENFYNENFFNTLNEKQVKPLLARIEKGEFNTYKNAVYDTKLRDLMKQSYHITIPVTVFANAYKLYKLNKKDVEEFLKTDKENDSTKKFMKENKVSKKVSSSLLKYVAESAEKSDNDIMKLIGKGMKEITILFEDEGSSDSEDKKDGNSKTDDKKDDTNTGEKKDEKKTKSTTTQTNNPSPLKGQDDKSKVKMPRLNIDSSAPKSAPAA